ncbi:PAS domain S-box protein [Halobacteria archaeon AArc-m2/3/4]|uniref:histidine kinase n=1 Tax=Natronoglomus mannanivorans TaxID=2979990 RepID=A0ABT2QD48_9EURY|nr:PAS domain S-box protein [Halobacteria archaeon AArc-m2/3/4]
MPPSSDREHELRTQGSPQEFVADLSRRALETDDLESLLDDASAGVATVLGTDYCSVFELVDDRRLRLREGAGWSRVGNQTVPADDRSQAGYTLRTQEPVVVEDLRTDDRVAGCELSTSCGIVSGVTAVVGPIDDPWGILGVQTTTRRAFTEAEVSVLRTVANVLASAVETLDAERSLDGETALKDRILETTPVGIVGIDDGGEIQFVNERAEQLLDRSREEITSSAYDDPQWGLTDAAGDPLEGGEMPFERVVDAGAEFVEETLGLLRPDGQRVWLSVDGVPLDTGSTTNLEAPRAETEAEADIQREADDADRRTGAVFTLTDITEQRRLETEFEEMLGRVSDAFCAVDDEFRFVHVNERAEELLEHSEAELLGECLWDVFPEAAEEPIVRENFHAALDSQEPTSYEVYYDPLEFWVEATLYPSETGVSVYFSDITDQKERERSLREEHDLVERIVETTPVGIVTLGADGSFGRVNDRAEAIVGYTADDFEGIEQALEALESVTPAGEPYPADEHPVHRVFVEGETVHDVEAGITRSDGQRVWLSVSGTPLRVDGRDAGAVITFADVTDQREAERALRERERQLSTVMSNIPGMIYRCRNDRGWPMAFVSEGCAELTGYDRDVLECNEVQFGEDVIVEEDRDRLWEEIQTSVDGRELFTVTYRIETADGDRRWVREKGRGIVDEDGSLESLEGVIIDVTERKEFEQELERSRAELERLNRINELVQEIVRRLVTERSRGEIEGTVCDRLAASEFYEMAWIGDRSVAGETETTAWAGVDEETATTIIDACAETTDTRGLVQRTLETRQVQVVECIDIEGDDACCRRLRDNGIESALAVPIQYRETLYGALVICADRADAFDERGRTILEKFGDTLGFAITATERKEALVTDERVELEIRVRDPDPDHFLFTVTADTKAALTIQGVVSHASDSYLVYATTDGAAERLLERAVDSPEIDRARLVEEYDDESLLEFVSTVPAMITTLAEYGGTVTTATAEDRGATLTVMLPSSVNVRAVVDAFQTAYPNSSVLTKRTVNRSARTRQGVRTAFLDRLTDKQRESLRAAYLSGYYDRPRATNGSELSEALGVSPSTFHQHRQAGVRKLLAATFDSRE